jgi:hypothetical protein
VKKRPHSVELARAEAEANRRAASRLHPEHSPEWFADLNMRALEDIARLGLFDCYQGMAPGLEWQADFWADMPWTDRERDRAIHLMLADPRFEQIRATILAEYGQDMAEELRAGLGGLEEGGAR